MRRTPKRLTARKGRIVFEELEIDANKMSFIEEFIQSIIVNSSPGDHTVLVDAIKRSLTYPVPRVDVEIHNVINVEIEIINDTMKSMNVKERDALNQYMEEYFVDGQWVL